MAERRYQQFYSYSGAGTVLILLSEIGIELKLSNLLSHNADDVSIAVQYFWVIRCTQRNA